MTPDTIISGAPIKRGGWQPHNYDGSLSNPGRSDEGRVDEVAQHLGRTHHGAGRHPGRRADGQAVWHYKPYGAELAVGVRGTEVSLLEMVAAYSTFPNRGIRMQPHLIRKVYNRDGSLLEEYDGASSRVISEYVALTMVQMMRGVTGPGGTAAAAQAAGHPIAGKTGTVNDHTDVWFLGYTTTYVTGIWMGNPLRKENLGNNMTGGHGALPYFNDFMNAFMKGKPIEKFPDPPPMPADINARPRSVTVRSSKREARRMHRWA